MKLHCVGRDGKKIWLFNMELQSHHLEEPSNEFNSKAKQNLPFYTLQIEVQNGFKKYPGQADFDMHLSPSLTVVELVLAEW